MIIVCLYVDDLLVTGSNRSEIEKFKERMESEFEMIDLGILSYLFPRHEISLYKQWHCSTAEKIHTGSANKVSDAELQ